MNKEKVIFWLSLASINLVPILSSSIFYFVKSYKKEDKDDNRKMRIGNSMLFLSLGISFISSAFIKLFESIFNTNLFFVNTYLLKVDESCVSFTKWIYLSSGFLCLFFGIYNGLVSIFISDNGNKKK